MKIYTEQRRNNPNAAKREASASVREIGELPDIVDAERRQSCRLDLRRFAETYFPQTFFLGWSPDHLRVIAKIEQAVLEGGLFAMAMPRGSGKSSLCETACLWAKLYGHSTYTAVIAESDDGARERILASIKSELENNDNLLADFPEVCYPIRKLDGITQRAAGQMYYGQLTEIGWAASEAVLPSIRPTDDWRSRNAIAVREDGYTFAAANVIQVAGITGNIRGMKFKRKDGRTARPELVLIDDPQTRESAMSPSQCRTREAVIKGDILGLAGAHRRISGLMAVTVVRPGDLADRILDRQQHPQWRGERTKMVYAWPTREDMWERYRDMLLEDLQADKGVERAYKYYAANREAMDEGGVVAWEQCFDTGAGEISAIQHAWNKRIEMQDEAFFAECQNDPFEVNVSEDEILTADQIAEKVNGIGHREVPLDATTLTAFIDVQKDLLWWSIVAWTPKFTGYVIDYGAFPDQGRKYFTLREARHTLAIKYPAAGFEATIMAGLEELTQSVILREYERDDGAQIRVSRCLIDAGWGRSTDVVYQFCRQGNHGGVIMPSHGDGVTASSKPYSEYRAKKGEKVGLNWRIPQVAGKRTVRHVIYDTNFWKSFVHARLSQARGDHGSLTLWGRSASEHRMLADHLTAESFVRTEGRGRTVDEWKIKASNRDNHLFDCFVGCAVAASMDGATLLGEPVAAKKRQYVDFGEMQREAKSKKG